MRVVTFSASRDGKVVKELVSTFESRSHFPYVFGVLLVLELAERVFYDFLQFSSHHKKPTLKILIRFWGSSVFRGIKKN